MERGGDPNLPNQKEQTALDVCHNEEIRRLLTASFSPPTQHAHSTPPTALPASVSLGEGNREPIEGEPKDKLTHSQDDSAFFPNPPPLPLQSVHHKVEIQSTTPSGSTGSEAPVPQSLEPVNATPSRTRKRSKREREKGRGFGDVSSSESDSELLVTVRKAPRLVDRLPDSVREEGVGEGGDVRCGEGEGEKGEKTDGRTESGDKKELEDKELVDVEKDGDEVKEEKDGAIDTENGVEEKSTNSGKQEGTDERERLGSDDGPHVGQEEGQGAMEEKASADVASNAAEESAVAAVEAEAETGEPEEHSAGKETEVEKCTTENTTAERGIQVSLFTHTCFYECAGCAGKLMHCEHLGFSQHVFTRECVLNGSSNLDICP